MKKTIILFTTAALTAACKQNTTEIPNSRKTEITAVKKMVAGKTLAGDGPFKGLALDNPKDFYCGMDVHKYGISDTLHYKGKIYGFCSKMCKEEFVKTPDKYLTQQ